MKILIIHNKLYELMTINYSFPICFIRFVNMTFYPVLRESNNSQFFKTKEVRPISSRVTLISY